MKNYLTNRKNLVVIVLAVLLVVAIVFIVLLVGKRPAEEDQVRDLQRTVKSVSRLIVLPENEQPTLATVSDVSKLKDQAFFANAKTGDKVLIYPESRKAILYSPSLDKIIEVSSLNLSANSN